MYVTISVIILIVSLLMMLVVLVQKSKGGGLASNFASSNQILGVRQTTDFLEKATWTMAIALVVLCLISSLSIPKDNGQNTAVNSSLSGNLPEAPVPAAVETQTPAAETQAPATTTLPQE